MAIAVETTFPGGTLDEYDGLLEQLGFHPQGEAEPGCLFHWVTKTEDGTRAVDVWESTEAFTRFLDERLGPVLCDRGLARPQVRIQAVHSYLIA